MQGTANPSVLLLGDKMSGLGGVSEVADPTSDVTQGDSRRILAGFGYSWKHQFRVLRGIISRCHRSKGYNSVYVNVNPF